MLLIDTVVPDQYHVFRGGDSLLPCQLLGVSVGIGSCFTSQQSILVSQSGEYLVLMRWHSLFSLLQVRKYQGFRIEVYMNWFKSKHYLRSGIVMDFGGFGIHDQYMISNHQ